MNYLQLVDTKFIDVNQLGDRVP